MWRIKDPELKRKMNQFVSDEEIDRICRCDMMDSFDCIFFSFEDDCVSIRIDKSFLKKFPITTQITGTLSQNLNLGFLDVIS